MQSTIFFFSSRRRHTRWTGDWSSDVCSSDLRPASRTAGSTASRSTRPGRPARRSAGRQATRSPRSARPWWPILPPRTTHHGAACCDVRAWRMMRVVDDKAILHRYLRASRADLLSKLDGLGEYDVRRPLTSTGTNLLGLVKHVAGVELGYFGDVFGRPAGRVLPWLADDAEPNADMWATAEETRQDIVELHRFSAAHS